MPSWSDLAASAGDQLVKLGHIYSVVILVVAEIIAAVIVFISAKLAWNMRKYSANTEGTVSFKSCTGPVSENMTQGTCQAEVSYTVADKVYVLYALLPKGSASTVLVSYNPSNPEDATIMLPTKRGLALLVVAALIVGGLGYLQWYFSKNYSLYAGFQGAGLLADLVRL